MSLFEYPRINFAGKLRLNPGTANNDDYAQPGNTQNLMPKDFGPRYEGHAMGLLETYSATARRFGLDDGAYREWISTPQTFDSPAGGPQHTMPAEWNYYGDMSSTPIDIKVVGVQKSAGQVLTTATPDVPLTELLGATLDFYGNITDINPEGSPPATQFFVDNLSLSGKDGHKWLHDVDTSKGVGLWINFFRNVNAVADDGAGTCIHQVITGDSVKSLPGFESADGAVMRSYIYLPLLPQNLPDSNDAFHEVITDWYRNGRANPKTMQIIGTLAPWHEGDPIAMPPGRQLISRETNVSTAGHMRNNGGGHIALAPATAHQHDEWLSVDFSGSFPDQLDTKTRHNPKFDMGPVWLMAKGEDLALARIAQIDYRASIANDAKGWIFDFDLGDNKDALDILRNGGHLVLVDGVDRPILTEVDYYVVTDHLAVYGQQGGPDSTFVSQGADEPISVRVYHRGTLDPGANVHMWQYRSAPIQAPGDAVERGVIQPGDTIRVGTEEPGAFLLTFRVEGETNPPAGDFPPLGYAKFAYPPAFPITWAPSINVRILPTQDYSEYYEDAEAAEPVGNERLTWDFVYDQVLRTYALLFPAMNNKIDLASQEEMTRFAPYVLRAVSKDNWKSVRYMPPTRDLSDTKRTLLQAWCRKAIRAGEEPEGIC